MTAPASADFGRTPGGPADGFRAFVGGIAFILTTPRVWGYALVPITMVLMLLLALGGLGVWGALRAGDTLLGVPEGTWGQAARWLVKLGLAAVALLLAALGALGLAQPFSGFALDAIVSAQERALTGAASPAPGLLGSVARSVRVSLVTLGVAL